MAGDARPYVPAGDTAMNDERRATLRALHEMRPWPGLAQAALRIGAHAALTAWAVSAFTRGDWGAYAAASVLAGVALAAAISLTHDALHHRLTGRPRLDDVLARVIAWPIAWPIGIYTLVHLRHHRWAGGSFADPERIQPTMAEYAAAGPLRRWYCRNQIWFNVCVAGGAGLLARLLGEAAGHRAQLPQLTRAAALDAAGIALCTAMWTTAAYAAGGAWLVLGCAGIWVAAERAVGMTHQLRNHAEHYGLWGARATARLTQYQNARDIDTHPAAAWFFNHLNRHATHHALMGVPFYNLEAAHVFLVEDFARQHVSLTPAGGYLKEVLAANRLARRGGFIVESGGTPS